MADQRVNIKNADHGLRVTGQDVLEETTTQKHKFGARLVVGDKVFRYCKTGTAGLTIGKVTQANNALVTGTIYAAADSEQSIIKITTTAIATGDYDEGYIVFDRGTGAGTAYKVKNTFKSDPTYTKLRLYDPLFTKLDTTTSFKLLASRYNGIKVAVTNGAGDLIGVPMIAISATSYAWIQTKGPLSIWLANSAGTTMNNRFLCLSSTTDGALECMTTGYVAASATTGAMTVYDYGRQVVARCMTKAEALTTEVYNLVDLMLE